MRFPTGRAILNAALVAFLLAPNGSSEARPRGTAPGSTFNGGATQVNPNFIANRGAYTFADMAKNSGAITVGTVTAAPNTLDTNGYPTSGVWQKTIRLPLTTQKSGDYIMTWTGGGPNTVMRSPGGSFVSGSLNGANGTYRFTPTNANDVNANISVTIGVQTTGASYSPVTRLSVVNVNDFTAWQADQNAFSAEFLAAITAGKYGVTRTLNWGGSFFQGANQAMWTDWLSRKPLGYHVFSGPEYRANWWAGNPDNGGSGNDYTLTTPAAPAYIFGNGAPVDKQIMHVAFNQDATFIGSSTVTFTGNTVNWSGHPFTGNEPIALYKLSSGNNMPTGLWDGQNYYVVGSSVVAGVSFQVSLTPGGAAIGSFGTGASGNYGGVRLPTLNINGSGAIPIRNAYGDRLGSGDMPLALSGGNPVYGTMLYDADLNAWLKTGACSTDGSQGFNNGVPPEVLFNLAVKTRTHPYFVSSAFALDPMTDFWPTFAAYVKANSPSWMIPRYEPVNEMWNTAAAFWNTRYAWNKAWAHWGVQFGNHQWQGKTVSTLGQAINAVYGGLPDGTKYHLVNGVQMASAYNTSASSIFVNNERMTASSYVGQAAAAQSGYTKSAASNWTTHVAPANYLRPNTYNTLSELQTGIIYGSNLTSAAARSANLNTYANDLLSATVSGTGIFTLGSPGVLNWPSHGLTNGASITVYTSGSLFTGLTPRGLYYVSVIDADHLNLSLSNGGALINFTGSQSGSHIVSAAPLRDFGAPVVSAIMQAFATWAAGYTNNAGNPVGLTFYEGGWSPDTSGSDATTTVTAATNAASAVVTVGANTTIPNGSSVVGVAAQVGGAVSFSSIGGMTQLNTSTFSATFAGGGSANISGTNSLILNQAVSFLQTQGDDFRLPPEITPGAPYYVVSTGNPFQISATRGGAAITTAGASIGFGVVASPGWFVTNVAGQNLTLDVDSSAFGAYTSGGTLTYNRSAMQVSRLRSDGRLAPDLQGIVYGNTSPIPSVLASIAAAGGAFPSKFELSGVLEAWGALQPSIYDPYPTTGEWKAFQNFSPAYNFLLKRDLNPTSNDNDPMWLEKAA